ncbi:MAG: FtsQ-type POTRA domain-containing protein [Candidatus Electrothrix sp. AU1_5]|nr:FtsQ-type POTRA domain-containing protein [Candidatus Electrothrix gigas]
MARKKIRYRRQRAGRSPMLRQFRSHYVQPPAQLRIRVNMGRYQQPTSLSRRPKWNFLLIKRFFFLLILVMLCAVTVRLGKRVLEHSDAFALRQVAIQGNRMLTETQIRTLAAIQYGKQLFSITPEEVEERICQDAWVEQVEVERAWPDTLLIKVFEHRPLAMINIEGKHSGLYYLGYDETLFAQVEPSQDIDYPVITGFVLPAGRDTASALDLTKDTVTKDARTFLHVAARGNPILPLQSISEIHIDAERGIIVYLVEHPFPIYVGYGNVEKRYYQLVVLLERFYRKKEIEGIKEIRMDYHEGRILVARSEP